ncbi:MAG: 2-phosphosulfolactate phosphatase [Verrucomicrobiota bacterium]
MATDITVLFTPADFEELRKRDLSQTGCVVFDVLRATTSMLTALANGAQAVAPVAEISEALALKAKIPDLLLAGERNGVRIRKAQTGSVDFDFGNSPREFTPDRVAGKTIATTTTNGTRALRACARAQWTLVGGFVNLSAVAEHVVRLAPGELVVVCSGTFEQAALEDVLAAGALLEALEGRLAVGQNSDTALMAQQLYQMHRADLMAAMRLARNGRKLLSIPDLCDDVRVCVQRDTVPFAARLEVDGLVRKV